MRTILIVDDDPINRLHLKHVLQRDGYRTLDAENGREGVDLFLDHYPDLVLMDVLMPVMDGYEATRRIKAVCKDNLVPVIFLTGVSHGERLAECLNCGGDDFISKPFDGYILKARIDAWLRKVELAEQVAFDREAIENVLLKMRQDDHFNPSWLRILVTPVERTAGDMVLSAFRSDGVQHVMVGDFTGHGLSAAICGPLVSEIFYRLTTNDVPAKEVLREINWKIYKKLPANIFLTTVFLEMDRLQGKLRIWNCSMPDILIFRDGRLQQRISSNHVPLGIHSRVDNDTLEVQRSVAGGDLVYVFSDGVIETRSPEGKQFGLENCRSILAEMLAFDQPLEKLLEHLEIYRGERDQEDDITLLEMKC